MYTAINKVVDNMVFALEPYPEYNYAYQTSNIELNIMEKDITTFKSDYMTDFVFDENDPNKGWLKLKSNGVYVKLSPRTLDNVQHAAYDGAFVKIKMLKIGFNPFAYNDQLA